MGFTINWKKSKPFPAQTVNYCGLCLNSEENSYNILLDKQKEIKKAFREWTKRGQRRQLKARLVGLLAFWLYALGLTSGFRRWNKWAAWRALIRILCSRPWPLPGPPRRFWAADASLEAMAVVDDKHNLRYWRVAPARHIYWLELWALFMAINLAPVGTAFATDASAVFYGTRRSRKPSPLLLQVSISLRKRNGRIFWIPSACNPADQFTRKATFEGFPTTSSHPLSRF